MRSPPALPLHGDADGEVRGGGKLARDRKRYVMMAGVVCGVGALVTVAAVAVLSHSHSYALMSIGDLIKKAFTEGYKAGEGHPPAPSPPAPPGERGSDRGRERGQRSQHSEVSSKAELNKYQSILSFPALDKNGDPVDRSLRNPRLSSKRGGLGKVSGKERREGKKVSAKESREEINAFYNTLQAERIAVPTGAQAVRARRRLQHKQSVQKQIQALREAIARLQAPSTRSPPTTTTPSSHSSSTPLGGGEGGGKKAQLLKILSKINTLEGELKGVRAEPSTHAAQTAQALGAEREREAKAEAKAERRRQIQAEKDQVCRGCLERWTAGALACLAHNCRPRRLGVRERGGWQQLRLNDKLAA
eukprot:CAMPEP_0177712578 /NCGR_PEP_ID=MMETSP0484_2-20121128/12477_1 /TAXON_ID=354590 /ORGANISM="Rhodomonas lens, Strain RHODO" /LENGTH=360 /DNA_ID=CAMNT_0019224403 /DNA_START=6 /DNA_END=1084 /DNA_ORIENTATION=+